MRDVAPLLGRGLLPLLAVAPLLARGPLLLFAVAPPVLLWLGSQGLSQLLVRGLLLLLAVAPPDGQVLLLWMGSQGLLLRTVVVVIWSPHIIGQKGLLL